jgi:hypothetical protein
MPFKLTVEYLQSILDPTEKGDWQSFTDAIDPDVHGGLYQTNPVTIQRLEYTYDFIVQILTYYILAKLCYQNLEQWRQEVNNPILKVGNDHLHFLQPCSYCEYAYS